MKNKKGFVFIETIIMIVVLAVSLLAIYNAYSNSVSNEKKHLMYDDASYIYRTYYLLDYLLDNSNIMTVRNKSYNNYIKIGYDVNGLFSESAPDTEKHKEELSFIFGDFHIGRVYIVTSDMIKSTSAFNDLNDKKLVKYIKSIELPDADKHYYLVVEYNERYDAVNGVIGCVQQSAFCESYFSSLEITDDMSRSS